jgi:hypothetical protein
MTTLLTSSQIVRSCRQVEILRIHVTCLILSDLAELEFAENMTDITLFWNEGPSIEVVLWVFERWRHLSRLTVQDFSEISVLQLEVLSDFIMKMEHLSYLHIAPQHDHKGQLEILRDKVNKLILPLRPNFKFDISRSD